MMELLTRMTVALFCVLMGLIVAMAIGPDHKRNCDQFGATSFGQAVYVCHPKDK